MDIHFNNLSRSLWKIYEGFVTLGRLYALKSLSTRQINDKLILNEYCQRSINAAARVSDFMHRAYAKREPLVYWCNNLLPSTNGIFIDNNIINKTLLDNNIDELSSSLSIAIDTLYSKVEKITAIYPFITLLRDIAPWLCLERKNCTELSELLGERNQAHQGTTKALSGPMHVLTDSAFTPSYSLLRKAAPEYGNTLQQAAPYYWSLAARESLAADLCALSLIEYDGLPIDFYVDMAKQAHDEIRHAAIFLEVTRTLLPHFKATLKPNDDLYHAVMEFENQGSGLPIPLERNLYETMWNTTLEERFILMHHDTESPGIQRLRQKLESALSNQYPSIANNVEIVMREEVTHARIGDRWLKYLLPNPVDRANAIKHARLLRGILILTPSAHYCNEPLPNIIYNMINTTAAQGG